MAPNTAVARPRVEDAHIGDLPMLLCFRAACGDTAQGNCICHQIRRLSQVQHSDEHRCSSPRYSLNASILQRGIGKLYVVFDSDHEVDWRTVHSIKLLWSCQG